MRKTLLFLMLLSVKLTSAQVVDDFSDGNFTSNPAWVGSNSLFNINSSKQLQTSLSSTGQTVSLVTSNLLALNVKCEFLVQMNFDPSTSNQAKIYLIADNQDLNAPLNGYFVQIGESGSTDSYDLYRQNGATVTKIIDGPAKTRVDVNTLLARIKVTRNDVGKWELFTDITGGTNYALEGSVIDLTYTNSDWFGVRCEYTATRSTGFIFDDFTVSELTPDVTPPTLVSAKVLDELNVEVVFSERLQPSSALMANNYAVANLSAPTSVTATSIANVYKLTFASALPSGDYKLTVTGVRDLKGNQIGANNTATFFYVKPYTLKKGDVLISEVLSNPRTGGVDFVEIYNNTNQTLDLKELQLANIDATGVPASIKNVSSASVYMPAKTYWVLTTNPTVVKQHYNAKFPNQFVQMSSFPSYNNDKGSVVLLGTIGLLERFDYDEGMHIALLKDGDGVSLERTSFLKAANDVGNFKSAAKSSGFATPSYKNSQEEDLNLSKNKVSLVSKTFSPDGDGFEDLMQIDYSFANNGNFASVNIYTDKGILVRKLERNTTIPTVGSFTWDGLNDAGQQSKIGIYIIKFDTFALNGKTESFKQTCVLAAKL
ncbi:lamin tail domain-containing protein [Pedobacter frigiditerrae]|uniref:lamin tail domain-containing protein n=1 Tax=Pedobacter frigiditerrae TaxID=2530452 RepID=UPI00292DCCDE|nr:lamin tail domain-containing protein [Pedobacter frigiditerrae]